MKIVVFSDLHGSLSGAEMAVKIAQKEQPNKVVFCGDTLGCRTACEQQVAETLQTIDSVLYFVRGNNDRACYDSLFQSGVEDYTVMYHFGRTLFFTHGDRYNGWNVPPMLKEGDAIVFGHTHWGCLTQKDGLFALNVGSLARPRDGVACYLVLDENGATLKRLNGNAIYNLKWN